VRAFARGHLEKSARAFETALGYDPDLLWPRWNLARLHLRQGQRLCALAQYEALQENLPRGLRPAFEQEMDAVTGRREGLDNERSNSLRRFTVPLANPRDLLEEM
jgi:hypothetical protein